MDLNLLVFDVAYISLNLDQGNMSVVRDMFTKRQLDELFLVSLLVLGWPTGWGVDSYLQALANQSSGTRGAPPAITLRRSS